MDISNILEYREMYSKFVNLKHINNYCKDSVNNKYIVADQLSDFDLFKSVYSLFDFQPVKEIMIKRKFSQIDLNIDPFEYPNDLNANYYGYKIISDLYKNMGRLVDGKIYNSIKRAFTFGKEFYNVRKVITNNNRTFTLNDDQLDLFLRLYSTAEEVDTLDAKSSKAFRAFTKKYDDCDGFNVQKYLKRMNTLNRRTPMEVITFKYGKTFRVINNVYFVTRKLTKKISYFFRTLAFLVLCLSSVCMKGTIEEFIETHTGFLFDISEWNSEAPGEVIKTAKGILMASMSEVNYEGLSMKEHYISQVDSILKPYAVSYMTFINNFFIYEHDKMNVACLYKSVLHPDMNIHKAFKSLDGLKEPYRADNSIHSRFIGTLKKNIALSLLSSNYVPTFRSMSPDDLPLVNELINEMHKPSPNFAKLQEISSESYYHVKFVRNEAVPNFLSIKHEPEDKSSFTTGDTTIEDWEKFKKGEHKDNKKFKEIKNINDIVSYHRGESSLDPEKALARFNKVRELHEAFESKYPNVQPEDIPQEDFEEFIRNNSEIMYKVNTEPKLGEMHKILTRMFYIPEQELKAVTQRIERIAKQVSKRQAGVSITKNVKSRTKDIERIIGTALNRDNKEVPWYVSFDLSKFSQKFPMSLLRDYGSILAEITGDEFLNRIDLVFRASIVFHKSRNFFDYKVGIKGGFEGFFNFVWTSLHTTIMEIALQACGYVGMYLVYSDDGLLVVYTGDANDDISIPRLVSNIKRIYNFCGLMFHLGKTIISRRVWEYLGDFSADAALFRLYFKEMSSFYLDEGNVLFESYYEKLHKPISKARALIMSGAPLWSTYIIMVMNIIIKLNNIYPTVDFTELPELLVMPDNIGGLRIPSPEEISSVSSIGGFGHFVSDLMVLQKTEEKLYERVMKTIKYFGITSNHPCDDIAKGIYIKTCHPKLKDGNIKQEILQYVNENSSRPVDTKKPEIFANKGLFCKLLKCIINIDPELISQIIIETPKMLEYQKRLALSMSRACQKLLSQRELSRIQLRDRRNLDTWIVEHLQARPYVDVMTTPASFMDFVKFTYKDYSIVVPKMSVTALVVLSECEANEENVSEVKLIKDDYKPFTAMCKPMLRTKFPETKIKIRMAKEKMTNDKVKMEAEYAELFSKAATCMDSSILKILCAAIGIGFPITALREVDNIHRIVGNTGFRPDVNYFFNDSIRENIKFTMPTRFARKYFNIQGVDRTTYIEGMKWLAYYIFEEDICNPKLFGPYCNSFKVTIDPAVWGSMSTNQVMKFDAKKSTVELDNALTENVVASRDFGLLVNSSLQEYRQLVQAAALTSPVTEIAEVIEREDMEYYINILKKDLRHKLYKAITLNPKNISETPELVAPMPFVIDDYLDVIFATSLSLISNKSKSSIEYIATNEDSDSIDFKAIHNEIIAAAHKVASVIRKLPGFRYLEGELTTPMYNPVSVFNKMKEHVRSKNIFSSMFKHLIVIKEPGRNIHEMTASHQNAFREIIFSTYRSLLAKCKECKWNNERILATTGIKYSGDVDEILDYLCVYKECIRSSYHRTVRNPANNMTVKIELYKYYCILGRWAEARMSDCEVEDPFDETLELYEINEFTKAYKNLGRDHLRKLREVMPKDIAKRCLYRSEMFDQLNYEADLTTTNKAILLSMITQICSSLYNIVILPLSDNIIEVNHKVVNYIYEMNITTSNTNLTGEQVITVPKVDYFRKMKLDYTVGYDLDFFDKDKDVYRRSVQMVLEYCVANGIDVKDDKDISSGMNNTLEDGYTTPPKAKGMGGYELHKFSDNKYLAAKVGGVKGEGEIASQHSKIYYGITYLPFVDAAWNLMYLIDSGLGNALIFRKENGEQLNSYSKVIFAYVLYTSNKDKLFAMEEDRDWNNEADMENSLGVYMKEFLNEEAVKSLVISCEGKSDLLVQEAKRLSMADFLQKNSDEKEVFDFKESNKSIGLYHTAVMLNTKHYAFKDINYLYFASAVAKSGRSGATNLHSYVLFYCFLKYKSDFSKENINSAYKIILNKHQSSRAANGIKVDVLLISSWLRNLNFALAIEVDPMEFKYMYTIPKVNPKYGNFIGDIMTTEFMNYDMFTNLYAAYLIDIGEVEDVIGELSSTFIMERKIHKAIAGKPNEEEEEYDF